MLAGTYLGLGAFAFIFILVSLLFDESKARPAFAWISVILCSVLALSSTQIDSVYCDNQLQNQTVEDNTTAMVYSWSCHTEHYEATNMLYFWWGITIVMFFVGLTTTFTDIWDRVLPHE